MTNVFSRNVVTSLIALVLVGTVACSSSSTPPQGPESTGPIADGGSTITASDGGAATNADAAAPLTGDVWVDATGKVIGADRTIPNQYHEATQAMIDAQGVAWSVDIQGGKLGTFDPRGAFYYSNADCTGTRWLGPGYTSFTSGIPDVGVSFPATDSDDDYAIKQGAVMVKLTAYKSYYDAAYGCQSGASATSIMPEGYEDSSLMKVTPLTGFQAPFRIEHH